MDEHRGPSKGFVVREAPWTTGNEKVMSTSFTLLGQLSVVLPVLTHNPFPPVSFQAPDMSSSEDFPSFGAPVATKTSPWGPKRF